MDIRSLITNVRLGLYDLDPGFISGSGILITDSRKSKARLDEMRQQFREDCILAMIDLGLSRSQARSIYGAANEVAGVEGPQAVLSLVVSLIKSRL